MHSRRDHRACVPGLATCIANFLCGKRKKPPAPPERGDEWLWCRGYDLS